jgi:hypothetical protein
MRVLGAALLVAVACAAPAAAGPEKPKPTKLSGSVQITFAGRGEQTMHEYKQWIYQVDNRCGYDKTVDNRATFTWTSTWNRVALPTLASGLGGRSLAGSTSNASGRVAGTEIRTDCAYPVPLDGWAGTSTCDEALVFNDAGTLDARAGTAGSLIIDLQAPTIGMQTPTACALRPRNSQLAASFKLTRKTLVNLKRGKPLTVRVGTNAPSLIPQTREYNCGNSEPPYEGVQIDDRCLDVIDWEGTVTITKNS